MQGIQTVKKVRQKKMEDLTPEQQRVIRGAAFIIRDIVIKAEAKKHAAAIDQI